MSRKTTSPPNGGEQGGNKADSDEQHKSNTDQLKNKKEPLLDRMKAQRVDQNYSQLMQQKLKHTQLRVRKPRRQEWVRTHSEADYRQAIRVLQDEWEMEKPSYWIDDRLAAELAPEDTKLVEVLACITSQGEIFLWQLGIPSVDGRVNDWTATAREIAQMAQERWVRVAPNMSEGRYDYYIMDNKIPDPEWPDMGFGEMIELAFKSRIIDQPDHPLYRRMLQGG